jgi:thiol-disulfide isomerase/thioredoxin
MVFSLSAQAADSEVFLSAELIEVEPLQAPTIKLSPLMSETEVSIDYQNKVTLVHFWATWCIACRKEFPQLEKLQQDFKGGDLQIIAIAADSHDATHQYKLEHNLLLPVLIDQYGKALKDFHVKGLPASFLIDANGRIRYQATGRVNWEKYKVREVLAKMQNL